MDILASIIAERRHDIEAAKAASPVETLKKSARQRKHHSLIERLTVRRETCIIAEVKKASPSAGLLQAVYNPAELARSYAAAGAVGVSVLTEPHHFMGSGEHLREVRAVVDISVLRKDFIVDPYQVYEAAAWGADVILLIAAALPANLMRELARLSADLGLEVLAEAHNTAELEAVLTLQDAIVGVNSRNLKTLKTDLAVAEKMAALIPPDRIAIAESGIKQRTDVTRLEAFGYSGFLVGEAVLSSDDPQAALRTLIGDGGL